MPARKRKSPSKNGCDLQARFIPYIVQNLDDLLNPCFWVEVIAEFTLCVFVLTIVIWVSTTLNPHTFVPTTTHFGLFASFSIMAFIEGFGPISGAFMNPAGTWGFFLAGRISFVKAIFYMAAEIAGAAVGGIIGFGLTPEAQQKTFMPILPGPGITIGMGMAIEGILTFNFVVVALSCTNPKNNSSVMPSFPIAFCIGIGIMAAGTHTGGLQNPIIPFGLAVVTRNFTMHFSVYWAGPFIGATVAAIFYTLISLAKEHLNQHRFSKEPADVEEKQESPLTISLCRQNDGT